MIFSLTFYSYHLLIVGSNRYNTFSVSILCAHPTLLLIGLYVHVFLYGIEEKMTSVETIL